MSFSRNDQLRTALRRRAHELSQTLTVGDSVTPTLATEFAAHFEGRSKSATYQMICYYLRDKPTSERVGDRRRSYTDFELSQMELMHPSERKDYAKAAGKSLRALDAALSRYRSRMRNAAAAPISVKFAAELAQNRDYVNFSSTVELAVIGMSPQKVKDTRIFLQSRGLSLRAPNILYHAPSRRRYYMNKGEQIAILTEPGQFLRSRASNIKENWVHADIDPVADEQKNSPPLKAHRKYDNYPKTEDGAVDLTRSPLKGGAEVLASRLLEDLKTFQFIEAGTALERMLTKLFDRYQVLVNTPAFKTHTQEVPVSQGVMDFSDDEEWMKDFKPTSM